MSFSEIPPPPEEKPGNDAPVITATPPGPQSRSWMTRASVAAAPMGPTRAKRPGSKITSLWTPGTVVYSTAKGSNVVDVDGNRYVDLAAGFGAQLLGHNHPSIARVIELQTSRLLQALGDVHPSEAKIALTLRLAELFPTAGAKVILAQSGAEAVSAAMKTAALATGKPGIVAFEGAYHGLSYGPLAACGLRSSYREPFSAQLNPHIEWTPWPTATDGDEALERVRLALSSPNVGAILLEPIQGRAGVRLPPDGFLEEVGRMAKASDTLVIADEIWTGLGRSGQMLYSPSAGLVADIVCLGKGLGGGLPISACIGTDAVMAAWQQHEEVVHTSTFAGAPLPCATAIATLDTLKRGGLVERSRDVGQRWLERLRRATQSLDSVEVRGAGLMLGIELGGRARGTPSAKGAVTLQRELLERGYIVSSGGGQRETLVLTPPLTIAEELLESFAGALEESLRAIGA